MNWLFFFWCTILFPGFIKAEYCMLVKNNPLQDAKTVFFAWFMERSKKSPPIRELYYGSVDKVWLAVINSFHCGLYHHPLMCISLMETWAPAFVGKRDIRYNRKWWEAFLHPGKQLFPRISGSIANYYWYAGSAAVCIPLPVTKIQVWIGTLTPALWNIKVIEAI